MAEEKDRRFMALALALGRRGLGRVWPNPAVGCVIVRQGRIVGRGWTADGGRPHAEARALSQAKAAARGATAYVTLEPCAHHGQTPPCAETLARAGLARVVVAAGDPDPRVAGRGIAILRAADIAVTTGVLETEARAHHAGFFSRIERGRPYLTLKLATSLDGRIATATGESRWITGSVARDMVHALRAQHDAVMVGGGTARMDDPELTVRGLGIARQPVRIVLSRRLDLPRAGRLARTAREVPVWLCHGEGAPEAAQAFWAGQGAELLPCPVEGRQVDPNAALQALGKRGLTRILCEGGGNLAASLLSAGAVDELICFSAGVVLGAEGTPALGAMEVGRLDDAPRFRLVEMRPIGGDVMHRWLRA